MSKENPNDPNRMVPICIPFGTSELEQEDYFCSVNKRSFAIKRGVQVMVPYFLKCHIEECEAQKQATLRQQREKQREFSNSMRR